MFDPKGFENSRPDGFSVLEVVSGLPEEDGPRRFVPLKHTHLTGEIAGPLADLHLTQSFGYTAKECDKVLEAVYRFPLPGDAAVTGVTVRFGDVVLQAELKERAHAEAEYEAAKQEGRQATLATRESPDVFTLQVAGLKPDQEVVVETAYVQLARYEGADWTLRIPLTTSPRYVREDEGASRHAQGQPLLLLRDPIHRFSLDLKLQNAESIQSPTHALEVTDGEEGQKVRLREGEVVPDRDCVLTWRAQQADQHPAMHLLLHEDVANKQVYFLALLMEERGQGSLAEVADHCRKKLIRRHPHVFGDRAAETAGDVVRNWNQIKRDDERGGEIFGQIPETLPSTLYAKKILKRAADAGHDHQPDDILLAAVKQVVEAGEDPELALRRAADEYRQRVEEE